MKYVIGETGMTDIQMETYDTVMELYAVSSAQWEILKMLEEKLGKTNGVVCDIRKHINESNKNLCDKIEKLSRDGGEYTHLIKL